MDTDRTRRVDAASRDAATRIDRVDAEWLLLHALKRPRSWLFAHPEHRLDDAELSRYAALVARRAAGEPVAYLTGRCGFWTLELEVDPDVLIPRADTEGLVEAALARLPTHRPPRVADLGTGSGAIGLAIASERPDAQVVAVDASAAALAVAARNAARLGIANVALLEGDWFAPLAGMRFDLVASNPPYIASGDAHLRQGDLRHEPAAALASGVDGLDAIRRIVRDAPACLAEDGWLLVEHGWTQGDAVRALFAEAGFAEVATLRDLEQRERITLGHMPHAGRALHP